MKVMSFNIRYGTAKDGQNSWPQRQELVIERIRAFDPDLIGLQECRDDDQAAYVRAALPEYAFLCVQRGGSSETALEMAPVLFRKAAFDEIEHGHFWLSATPDVPGSKGWGKFPRTVTWVKLLRKQAPQHALVFLNTHFDYVGEAMLESARLLRRFIDGLGPETPVVLTGDFNADRDTPPYHALLSGAPVTLYDTYRRSHPGMNEGTFHNFSPQPSSAAIDWILVSRHFETVAAKIDRHTGNGVYPSDHYPVLATLALTERR